MTESVPDTMSYVAAVRMTMDAVARIGVDDALLAGTYRQLLAQAAELDAGKNYINLHKEFRLGLGSIVKLAEERRREIAERGSGALDLAQIIETQMTRDDTELEAEMAALPPPPPTHEPATK